MFPLTSSAEFVPVTVLTTPEEVPAMESDSVATVPDVGRVSVVAPEVVNKRVFPAVARGSE